LRHNEPIAGFVRAIERNQRLLREIRSILPPPLDAHCMHAALDDGVLTLITDSPVWSSRLRFFAPALEQQLGPRNGRICACRVRVQPSAAAPTRVSRQKLSDQVVQHLIEAASGIEDDRLATALRRLASTGTANR
jgi:hypothetical protein